MEKTCTSLFGAVLLVVFSRDARTQQEDCRARGSEDLKVLFFNRIFTYFFVLRAINFVKSSHLSCFPVLVLSIWFWPTLQTNAPVQVWVEDFYFFLQPLFSARREDVQGLSLRNRTGAAAQGSFFKVNKKCSQGEAAFHCAASDVFILLAGGIK